MNGNKTKECRNPISSLELGNDCFQLLRVIAGLTDHVNVGQLAVCRFPGCSFKVSDQGLKIRSEGIWTV